MYIYICKQNICIYICIYIHIHNIWVVVYLPLWKMMEFVSWDDDIPNWMESHKIPLFQTTNQIFYMVNRSACRAWHLPSTRPWTQLVWRLMVHQRGKQKSMKNHEFPMKNHGFLRKTVGFLWKTMAFYEALWVSMKNHGFPMKNNGFLRQTIGFVWKPWVSYEKPWFLWKKT